MSNNDKLMEIIYKEIVTLRELRDIMNNEEVAEIRSAKRDVKRKNYPRFDVMLKNGELYFVYVKPPWYKRLFGGGALCADLQVLNNIFLNPSFCYI